MIAIDLYRHRKLADQRQPAADQNRFAKYLAYFGVAFWIAYLIFIGVMLPSMLDGLAPNMEPYHTLNKGLSIIFLADFLFRFAIQKTPVQEVKPYLLFPVRKSKILNAYLLLSATNGYNLVWLCLFVPFAFLTVARFYGLPGVAGYCIGIWMLTLLNNYWYLLCRTLINEKGIFVLLPAAVYVSLLLLQIAEGKNFVSTFTMDLGEAYIEWNAVAFIGTIAGVLLMAFLVRNVQGHYIYKELSRTQDTKVKRISDYRFLERYGEVGEYLRLELKLIARNKQCRASFRTGCLLIIMLSACVSADIYTSDTGKSFALAYCYAILGIQLVNIMSYEGNYLDGLMSRKESVYTLLRAKYYFYATMAFLPFILLLPAVIIGKITLLASFAYLFLAIGPIYWLFFQLAAYNKKTASLNEKITGKNRGGTFWQMMLSFAGFMMPMLLNSLLTPLIGAETTQWAFIASGIAFVLASPWWIRNVYRRFMKRRYANMEGFRNSR